MSTDVLDLASLICMKTSHLNRTALYLKFGPGPLVLKISNNTQLHRINCHKKVFVAPLKYQRACYPLASSSREMILIALILYLVANCETNVTSVRSQNSLLKPTEPKNHIILEQYYNFIVKT